jgi:hypothetical protein
VSQIIIDSNAWLIFPNKAFSHRVLKFFRFVKVSSLFIWVDNWFSLKLRFLVLRVVLNCSVFFVKVSQVFVVLWVLVIVIRVESFICINRNSMKPCS